MNEDEKTAAEGGPRGVIRPTDDEARRLAKTLVRRARYGALAVCEPESGHPMASRVALATDLDGTPVILTSTLAGHTAALKASPACGLLAGEPGKGDPLAHARISLACAAVPVARDSDTHARLRRRYLARHPKAELYVDFGDFAFFRLELHQASLNGGFGKAFQLGCDDMLATVDLLEDWALMEEGAVAHMNADHADAVKLYAEALLKAPPASWQLACLDPEGLDLVAGDRVERLWFESPLSRPQDLRPVLVSLAMQAREASG